MNYQAVVQRLFGRIPSTVTPVHLVEGLTAAAAEVGRDALATVNDKPLAIARLTAGQFVAIGSTHAFRHGDGVAELASLPEGDQAHDEDIPVAVREITPSEKKFVKQHVAHGRKNYRFGKFKPGQRVKWKDEMWVVYDARWRGQGKFELMLISPDYQRMASNVMPSEIGEEQAGTNEARAVRLLWSMKVGNDTWGAAVSGPQFYVRLNGEDWDFEDGVIFDRKGEGPEIPPKVLARVNQSKEEFDADRYIDRTSESVDEASQSVAAKHARMMRGQSVVVSDDDMTELEQMDNWKNLASKPNPKQIGTKDSYIAWFKDVRDEEYALATDQDPRAIAVRELTDLQARKPRPANKMFGTNITSEQKAQHAEMMRAYNKEEREIRARIKKLSANESMVTRFDGSLTDFVKLATDWHRDHPQELPGEGTAFHKLWLGEFGQVTENVHDRLPFALRWEEKKADGKVIGKSTQFATAKMRDRFVADLEKRPSFVRVVSTSDPDGPSGFKESGSTHWSVFALQLDENVQFVDRYSALGIPRPDPNTMCQGPCEGVGLVPVRNGDDDPELRRRWEEAEEKNPADDGWHFVVCPVCEGSRLREGAVDEEGYWRTTKSGHKIFIDGGKITKGNPHVLKASSKSDASGSSKSDVPAGWHEANGMKEHPVPKKGKPIGWKATPDSPPVVGYASKGKQIYALVKQSDGKIGTLTAGKVKEAVSEAQITVKVTAKTGETWTTRINGTLDTATRYFVGKQFNIGSDGNDKMVTVKKVELVEGVEEAKANVAGWSITVGADRASIRSPDGDFYTADVGQDGDVEVLDSDDEPARVPGAVLRAIQRMMMVTAETMESAFDKPGITRISQFGYAISCIRRSPRVDYWWSGKQWTQNDDDARVFESRAEAQREMGLAESAWKRNFESIDEGAPKKFDGFGTMQARLEQAAKQKAGTGKAKITAEIHAWATKKFAGKGSASITSLQHSIDNQKIEISLKSGSVGSRTITVKPFGDYIHVTDDKGTGWANNRGTEQFFTVSESVGESSKKADVEAAWRRQGVTKGRPIDPDEYPPIKGLEGPFYTRRGLVVYYDPKEGRYYDSKSDVYLEKDFNLIDSAEEDETDNALDEARTIAAGGVVVNSRGRILLRKPSGEHAGYVWTFPKGTVDKGETAKEAALREVEEESGFRCKVVARLGRYDSGMSVTTMFLMVPIGKGEAPDWETEATAWVKPERAVELLAKTKNQRGKERDFAILRDAVAMLSDASGVSNGASIATKLTAMLDKVADDPDAFFAAGVDEEEEAFDEGVYNANDPSPFDTPEVAKAKQAARDADMKEKKRAADAARGPAEKLAGSLTSDERRVLGVTTAYIPSARRKYAKISKEAYDAAVASLKSKGLLTSQGALSPSTRDTLRALDMNVRKELFGESVDEAAYGSGVEVTPYPVRGSKEKMWLVRKDGTLFGYVTKFNDTRTDTNPWKAFRYKNPTKADAPENPDAEFLGTTYRGKLKGAVAAVVSGQKLVQDTPESAGSMFRQAIAGDVEPADSILLAGREVSVESVLSFDETVLLQLRDESKTWQVAMTRDQVVMVAPEGSQTMSEAGSLSRRSAGPVPSEFDGGYTAFRLNSSGGNAVVVARGDSPIAPANLASAEKARAKFIAANPGVEVSIRDARSPFYLILPSFKPKDESVDETKVTMSGATYTLVRRNSDGTVTVRNDNGDEFDSSPGESYTIAGADAPVDHLDPRKMSKTAYVAASRESLQAKRDAALAAVVKKAGGAQAVQALLTAKRLSASQRQLRTEYSVAKKNADQDYRNDERMWGAVWDRMNKAGESVDEGQQVPSLDSPVYREATKLRGYNVKVTPLSAHGSDGGKLLAQRLSGWTKADHAAAAATHAKMAAEMEKGWAEAADAAAMKTWGRKFQMTDYRISGIGSDEFDQETKEKLRHFAHSGSAHKDAAHAHKMAMRMRSLAKEDLDEGDLDEATPVTLFTHDDAEPVIAKIQAGVKAAFVSVKKAPLWSTGNPVIHAVLSLDPKASWVNGIFHNSDYAMFSIGADGTMEVFSRSHTVAKFRKSRAKSVDDVVKRINDWIGKAKVKESVDVSDVLESFIIPANGTHSFPDRDKVMNYGEQPPMVEVPALKLAKATIFMPGGFGAWNKLLVNDLIVWKQPYAQYPDALHVSFRAKGKRKEMRHAFGHKPRLVVYSGWNVDLEPESMFGEPKEEPSGVSVSVGRRRSFDAGWDEAMASLVKSYKTRPVMSVIESAYEDEWDVLTGGEDLDAILAEEEGKVMARPKEGDLSIEAQGNEVRIWRFMTDTKGQQIARSATFMGMRVIYWDVADFAPEEKREEGKQRGLTHFVPPTEAKDFTVARLWGGKRTKGQTETLLKKYLGHLIGPSTQVHVYYAGRGFSGTQWGKQSHFTVFADTNRLIESDENEAITEGYQHVHFKGSRSMRARVVMSGGKTKSVQGRTFDGVLMVHPTGNYQWGVTHIPTGLGLVPPPGFYDDREAVKFVQAASALGGWDFADGSAMPPELPAKMKNLISSFREHIRSPMGGPSTAESVDEAGNRGHEKADAVRLPILKAIDDLPDAIRKRFQRVRFVLQAKDIRGKWSAPDYALAQSHLRDIEDPAAADAVSKIRAMFPKVESVDEAKGAKLVAFLDMGENKNPRYAAVMDFGEHGIATYPVHGDTYQPKGKGFVVWDEVKTGKPAGGKDVTQWFRSKTHSGNVEWFEQVKRDLATASRHARSYGESVDETFAKGTKVVLKDGNGKWAIDGVATGRSDVRGIEITIYPPRGSGGSMRTAYVNPKSVKIAESSTEFMRASKPFGDGQRITRVWRSDGTIAEQFAGTFDWKPAGAVKPELFGDPERFRAAMESTRQKLEASGWSIETFAPPQ